MKILQVIPYFPPAYAFGGPVKVAYQISRELARRGHEVTVYTTDAKSPDSRLSIKPQRLVNGIKVHYMRNISLMPIKKFNLFMTAELASKAKEEIKEFDVVHLHEYRTLQNIIVQRYAKKNGVPFVLQAHGSLPRIMAWQRLKWIYDALFGYRLLRHASKVVALSQVEAEQYRRMGVPEEKIAIIPNGIDLSEYADLPPKGRFREKFGIKEDEKIVLYLGRIHKIKGIDFLIKSFAYLVKNRMENVKLVIAGTDDGYLNEAKFLVDSLGLGDRVLFTGMLSEEDKINAYVDSTICTYLSPYEPFGLVPLEAAASHKPVIVADGTVMSEIVNRGGFGFSVKYGETNGLAETVDEFLGNSALLRKMGEDGRKYVFENCKWADIIVRLERVYGQALKSRVEL